MTTYTIVPKAETRGDGNGWFPCSEADAVVFHVVLNGETVEGFLSRAEALVWISGQHKRINKDQQKLL